MAANTTKARTRSRDGRIRRDDPLWYKDAVIYQTHIKAFFDSTNDGIGDFTGLIEKLDYIVDLGATAIWLLPFYPSPLRDDGYDIADYRNINPAYGTMADFRRFVREAHARGLRIITELVVNHTSDQHPWFKRAREAKPGSAARDFYVWSDTDQKYQDTRIIFLDTEVSNWTWDPVAKAYYWHRFYSHQPDLNFDNPRVLREILSVLRFWLDAGVDGLRLDAVPYLIEREGTINENLPETHDILKRIRAEIDSRYSDRMLLAEANQWPEDVQEYFGEGDECHMAFHFPLMPRMYMAMAQEDRHPITDILRQTPEIPANCQWAVFLRNHDELTLEMVTDQERDYLWNFYASDRRMRINLGIRRRLAPLMENDRRRIELMNGLLMSMPGTPVIYYGDEIGMGDNVYLGDRDGVRTPMQWSPDRNAGFSRANPQQLYLPAIMDTTYGFGAVNVETQQKSPSSLLNWMRRLINVRQANKSFSRGVLNFIYPGNRAILAYLREFEGEAVLCVCNLSRAAQAVELDLSRFHGRVPIELLGRSVFPPIGDLPYLLTLGPHAFYWFKLEEAGREPEWHLHVPNALPELVTLVMRRGWENAVSGRDLQTLLDTVLPAYLPNQRWFARKGTRITKVTLTEGAEVGDHLLALFDVTTSDGVTETYFLPLSVMWDENVTKPGSPLLPYTLAKARRVNRVGAIFDGLEETALPVALTRAMLGQGGVAASKGEIVFTRTTAADELEMPEELEARRLGVEQSNTSVLIGEKAILKIYRRPEAGLHPEVEIGRFLTDVAHFEQAPALYAVCEQVDANGQRRVIAVLQEFRFNQGDGWNFAINQLSRGLEELSLNRERDEHFDITEYFGIDLRAAELLGQRTAEMHLALATPTDNPDFGVEEVAASDVDAWRTELHRLANEVLERLSGMASPSDEREEQEGEDPIRLLLGRGEQLRLRIDGLTSDVPQAVKTRVHGDYHLGQVIVAQNDIVILDFEGEPARSLEERRAKTSPAKDVAGMLRSFHYAAQTVLRNYQESDSDTRARARDDAHTWRRLVTDQFMTAYTQSARSAPGWPPHGEEARRLLDIFLLEKALYEILYEAGNRPDWITIPVEGVLDLLDGPNDEEEGSV